jgi:hypothetical protein
MQGYKITNLIKIKKVLLIDWIIELSLPVAQYIIPK